MASTVLNVQFTTSEAGVAATISCLSGDAALPEETFSCDATLKNLADHVAQNLKIDVTFFDSAGAELPELQCLKDLSDVTAKEAPKIKPGVYEGKLAWRNSLIDYNYESKFTVTINDDQTFTMENSSGFDGRMGADYPTRTGRWDWKGSKIIMDPMDGEDLPSLQGGPEGLLVVSKEEDSNNHQIVAAIHLKRILTEGENKIKPGIYEGSYEWRNSLIDYNYESKYTVTVRDGRLEQSFTIKHGRGMGDRRGGLNADRTGRWDGSKMIMNGRREKDSSGRWKSGWIFDGPTLQFGPGGLQIVSEEEDVDGQKVTETIRLTDQERKLAEANVEILAEGAKNSVIELGGRGRGRAMPPDAELVAGKFRAYDQNGDGMMSPDELSYLLEETDSGLSKIEIEVLFTHVDKNADGKISVDEFLAWLMQ